jgi:solute carrier family 45 protein 1/2/4
LFIPSFHCQGIHNIFIVIPQFLVTGFSSLIFAIFDPQNTGIPPHHSAPVHGPITNRTEPMARIARDVVEIWLKARQEDGGPELTEEDGSAVSTYGGSNSVVYIFRFGGIAATIAAVLSWRLAKELRHR